MAKLPLFDRIGMDVGKMMPVEDAIRWAAAHDVRFLDVQTDLAPNAMASMAARARGIRALCEETGVALGLHTLSGVNIAEVSPFVSDAADAYLRSYIDLARDTGAGNPGENRVRMALVAPLDECLDAAHRINSLIATL